MKQTTTQTPGAIVPVHPQPPAYAHIRETANPHQGPPAHEYVAPGPGPASGTQPGAGFGFELPPPAQTFPLFLADAPAGVAGMPHPLNAPVKDTPGGAVAPTLKASGKGV